VSLSFSYDVRFDLSISFLSFETTEVLMSSRRRDLLSKVDAMLLMSNSTGSLSQGQLSISCEILKSCVKLRYVVCLRQCFCD
jgi:hypothetical protein